ncbi:sensor histidine kinase [Luteimicrobium xylanilyticum]|uniref:sensor histidine kinase n=1 Tax=Luteimicrobium xylanilyticum TaxID=1133546 RepID=UPI0011D193C8|nr:sensor histidine kinase [Luteimicrobium xylanilyticum]
MTSSREVAVPYSTEDPWWSRIDRVGRRLLLPALAVSALLAVLSEQSGYGSARRLQVGLALTALTAVWVLLFPARPRRYGAVGDGVIFTIHVVLSAVLTGFNPWFAVFAWTGFVIADERVPRRALPWAVVPVALVLGASQVGGFPDSLGACLVWFLVAAVNYGIAMALYVNIERGVQRNAELARANLRLEAVIAENAGLHAQLVAQAREAGVQDERQRLAGEIHDTLAQGLAGIVTQLEAADGAPDDGARLAHLDRARALARESLTEARRSVRALRPEQLERATLAEALAEHAVEWTRASGVPVQLEVTGAVLPLPDDVGSALFRVAQEALTNVAKHARASRVGVTLTYLSDVVVLDVRDDGVGFEPGERTPGRGGTTPASDGGYGLVGMVARLSRVGGTLTLEAAPGEGVALSASVPTQKGTL